MRAVDKLDKLVRASRSAACSSSEAGLDRRAGRQLPGAGRDQHRRHLLRRAGARARRTPRAAGRGARRARRRGRRAAPRWSPTGSRSSPTSRSPAASTTTPARSSRPGWPATRASARSAPAVATTRSPPTAAPPTRASASRSASAGCSCRCSGQGVVDRRPLGARARCSSPSSTRSSRAAQRRARRAAARQRRPVRGGAGRPEVRQADPVRRATRHPVRSVPGRRRRARGGQGHPQRRPGRRSTSSTWTPPVEDLRPRITTRRSRGAAPVIRTHDAGSLRADHVGSEVTLAGWVARRRDHGGVAFIDLREASGVVQVVIRDEAVAHQPAQRVLPQGHRHRLAPPRGQPERQPAHRRDRGDRDRRRGAQRGGAAAVPDRRRTSRSARRPGCGTATSTCAAAAPTPRCACAAGQPGRARRPRRARTSSRSRRRP